MSEEFSKISEALKSLKPTGADPAKLPSDQGSNSDGKGKKGASETILAEAYRQGKEVKPNLPPPPPVQYDISGVLNALKDLETQFKRLGGIKV